MQIEFGVLGPVMAWGDDGDAIALKGPKHRAVLARLIVARGRLVPIGMLVDDLWDAPPSDAVGAIRTFVSSLRRALEPERPPRAPATLLVTEGPGYALRADPATVDAVRFERAVDTARTLSPDETLVTLTTALGWWRGPAYADFSEEHWARSERSRLAEIRLHAVELRATALLELNRAADAVPDLDGHVADHPWREEGWRLLALALYRSGRQSDALEVLRRARTLLVEQLGIDPGPELQRLESDILAQSDRLSVSPDLAADRVWAQAAASYDRAVGSGSRARLRSTVELLKGLAVTGGSGLAAAREQRLATILAAEELGDTELTARVIGAYDVPAIWARSDDPDQAAQVVAAAERALAALPAEGQDAARARLLTTIAIETRGDTGTRGRRAAEQAERIARRLDDPALLAFALNGVFMQSFWRAGLSERRDAIGTELIALSARHGLATFELLGRLIRMQARSALGDLDAADEHAEAADRLAERYESPLVSVFTGWYRALRLALNNHAPAEVATAYRAAATRMEGAGMPGLQHGILPLAMLALRVDHRRAAPTEPTIDWGPYRPWALPLVLLAEDRTAEAAAALSRAPEPPPDQLFEALWCLLSTAAIAVDDRDTMRRALDALGPAASELAAGSGLFSVGAVSRHLDDLTAALAG